MLIIMVLSPAQSVPWWKIDHPYERSLWFWFKISEHLYSVFSCQWILHQRWCFFLDRSSTSCHVNESLTIPLKTNFQNFHFTFKFYVNESIFKDNSILKDHFFGSDLWTAISLVTRMQYTKKKKERQLGAFLQFWEQELVVIYWISLHISSLNQQRVSIQTTSVICAAWR